MSAIIDRIRNWRLRLGVPVNLKARWRYSGDGVTKVSNDETKEISDYNLARENLEKWKAERRKNN